MSTHTRRNELCNSNAHMWICRHVIQKASLTFLVVAAWARATAADSITFSETYAERLAPDQSIATTLASSLSAAVTHPELGCVPLHGGMAFELSVGGLS